MARYDTVIKGGTIIDGLRTPRFRGDVGIVDGRIQALGSIPVRDGKEVIDAEGLIVAPGFVDLHTHYDSQVFWDPYCTISGWHGVTSVVIGNCGFGFAPVKAEDQDRAMLTMSRSEAVPLESLRIKDRGWIREGAPADLVIYDLDALAVGEVEKAWDYPAGAWRIIRKPQGYRHIMVNGEVTFRDNECAGSTPGLLLRHGSARN